MGLLEDIKNECERKEDFLSEKQENIIKYYIDFYSEKLKEVLK